MKTLTILGEWQLVPLTIEARHKKDTLGIQITVYISPKGKMYREAASWEAPDLLITAGIWSPAQDIRLVRITDKAWLRTVRNKTEGQ